MDNDQDRRDRVLAAIMQEIRQRPIPRRARPGRLILYLGGVFYLASVAVMWAYTPLVVAIWSWVIGGFWPDLLDLVLAPPVLWVWETIGLLGVLLVIRFRSKLHSRS